MFLCSVHKIHQCSFLSIHLWLVVSMVLYMVSIWIIYGSGWWLRAYPSEKYELVNWDDELPNIWEKQTCSKPPTRQDSSMFFPIHPSMTCLEIHNDCRRSHLSRPIFAGIRSALLNFWPELCNIYPPKSMFFSQKNLAPKGIFRCETSSWPGLTHLLETNQKKKN